MAWLRRPDSAGSQRAEASTAAVAVAPAPPAAIEHAAPGLKQALERFPRSGGAVLDLGPVTSAGVEFWNRRQARLTVLDLHQTLTEESLWLAPTKLPPWAAQLPEVLELDDDERFDLVLAWDLANYLGRERWAFVARELVSRLAPGASLHLLVRSGRQMPSLPSRYRIAAPDIVSETMQSEATVEAPRFAHSEVERLHPGLGAARSFLDKHGVQEFVLESALELNLPPRPVAQPRPRRR